MESLMLITVYKKKKTVRYSDRRNQGTPFKAKTPLSFILSV